MARTTTRKVREKHSRLNEASAASLAHDLKTPLVAIQGFAQLLELSGRDGGLTEKQKKYVSCILEAARSLNDMVDAIAAREETVRKKEDE